MQWKVRIEPEVCRGRFKACRGCKARCRGLEAREALEDKALED